MGAAREGIWRFFGQAQDQVFEYHNLFACCDGGERDTAKPHTAHCSLFKGNNDPLQPSTIISPLDPQCLEYFEFDEQGQIHAAEGVEPAENTIAFLNLRAKSLRLLRQKAIETYIFHIWTEEMDTVAEMERLMRPVNGKLESFCTAIFSVLRHYP